VDYFPERLVFGEGICFLTWVIHERAREEEWMVKWTRRAFRRLVMDFLWRNEEVAVRVPGFTRGDKNGQKWGGHG
jgi:hypothetical protein